MSMYRFVKEGGSSKRLFVQGTLESDDSKPLKSSLKKSSPSPVGSPITTSLNLASVPRSLREGLTRHETVYDGNYPGMERTSSYRSGSYREESYNGRIVHDGNQTHFEYDGGSALAVPTSAGGLGMSELQAIHTNKRMSTEVLGSSLESTKISKKDDVSGQRRITTRIVRKVTTLTRGEEKASAEDVRGGSVHRSAEHYRHVEMESSLPRKVKISDIVIGQEANVTAREALLSWARRSTAKYPGVRVADFTSSWRDGLAFNALIHRNRPDLIDWRNIRSRQVRERLETAFHVVEKEYGVTRLLDPEDVDTHEPDEKSLITYISSLYETFPEPPAVHPLFDAESQRRAAAYTELAAQHRAWLHEKCALMQDRAFPSTLIEMKKLLSESTRFRQEEVPLRQREKQKLFHHYRELEKYFESVGECDIEPTLRPDALEQAWSRLLMAQQERERDLTDEIRRLERLQRLAEKLHRDIKQTEGGLDSVERHIESEIRRVERGVHPADAKLAAENIEQELRAMEHTIQEMFQDSHALREGRYPQAADLHRRVQQVHDRWVNARQSFTGRLVPRLSSVRMPVQQTTVRRETRTVLETRVHDADPKFQQLSEATRWCKERLKKLHESDYGSDLPSVQHELDKHQREHKQIDQFHSKVEQCVHNRANFSGEELNLYNQHLSQLQKLYAELLSTSTKRMSDLDALQDFLQSATAELNWLNEKEQVELSRDWADPHINLPAVQHYYEQLMSSLEKRELQFSNVIDRGEALIAQHHPATKTIESHLQVMQSQWAWVLQLTLCLETHLKHTTQYHNFFEEVKEAEKWIQKREEALNSTFSQSEFTLDQGERLLKGMQELREELNSHGGLVSRLVEDAQEIRPVKQRRAPITRPLRAETVCAYKHANVAIEKGSAVTVVDNSGRSRWRVRLGGAGTEVQVPGAVVALPPPCQDAIDAAGRLRSAYDRVIQLWQRKQLRMRQNMIFATIKVVKGWDFPQFVAMGAEQRQAIRRALNEDAEKLLAEGDPADPQLRRLRREIDDVNRLFDEFERRARAEEESKNAARIFTEQSSNLLERLEVLERQLHERIASHIPRDLDTLEHLVLQHKDWETSVHSLTSDVEEVQATFRGIALKTPAMKKSLDKVMGKWNDMQSKSQLFVDRLKFVEIVVNSMEENHQTISEFEIKLAQFNDLPNDVELLKDMHEDLLRMQVAVSKQQIQIDQMNDDSENCRRLVETSRAGLPHSSLPRSGKHIDLERLDKEVSQLNNRWNNVCSQLAERLRSCEAAYQLLRNYNAGLEKEAEWIDDAYSKLQAQPPIEVRPKEHFEPTRNLLTSVVERTPKIEKVNVDGGRYIREAKQAVEEKYRLCDETLSKLLEWIAVVEERLANQEAVKEDMDELRNQINILKLIKDDLESHQRQVSACADQAKQLLVSGGDVLAPHEVAALERGVRQLKQRCDKCTEKCDKMLRRLAAARDELGKFTNELNTFNTWMEGAYRTLEDKEAALSKLNSLPNQSEEVREFVSDVIAHQADLRFITMSAQKFVDESKEFLSILNEYRTSLPSRLSHMAARAESGVREGAGAARRRHADLCARAQRLQDWLRGAADGTRHYHDALQRAGKWINEIEPQVRSVLSEPVGGEPRAVESQLSKAKTLHNEIVSQGRLIDNAKDACEQLVKSLEGNLTPSEIRQLEVPVIDLTSRYKDISDAVGARCADLEAALLQCQGLQDAAETQAHWVGQAESLFKSQQKPASLIRERLDEQIREQRISIGELEARRPTLAKLLASARQAALTPSNARIAKKLEQRAEDIYAKYEKLVERSSKRSEFLEEVSSELAVFAGQAAALDAAHAQLLEQADTRDLARMPAEELGGRLAQLANYRDKQMPLLEECLRNGKQLISKKDVTDTHVIRDRMKALENQWRDFNATLEEKQKLSKQRADQLNQYESLKIQVLDWLQSMESRVTRLQPVAVDLDVIKQQQDELRPLAKEYRDFSITIDKVNEAGAVYEALTRGDRADSPHRRRQIYSPTKRQTPSRTLDGRSPSPSKGHGLVSPGSTHSTSSGFSSRRSSQDGFHLEELSPVQQQLSEINNRYSLLGTKLSDRAAELDAVRDELRRHLDSLRALNTFLDKVQRQLPKESVPNTKEEADKTIKQARAVLEEMYEKQSILDSTKTQVRELLKRKQSVVGADRIHDEMEDVASRWKALHDAFKDKIRLMEEMKDFHDTYSNLSVWLQAKDRMMAALGPISSDSRMVQTQVQQVQVLREEFRGQQPQLVHLEEVGTAVLCRLEPASPDATKLKQKVAEIQDRWNDLLNKLEKRADSLGAAADTSREFDAGLSRLRDALQTISDKLDDVAMENEPDEQLRKIENLERQLEGQRPLLADLEGAGAALAQVLSDPASRQDIQSKLAAVARQYDNLQRKLDHRKAEIEAALKDGRNLEENVARTLGWLQSELNSLPGRLQVSADATKLQQQLERHEPLYRELTQREHELIMLLDKGREMEKKPAHQGLRKDLDRIQAQWDKLKRETVDRYTRLQTAKEHCRKFHKAQESFVPWLSDLEDRLAKLPATAFTKKEVEKQLRELQQIRNDIWKRSGEYENNKTLGETFISSCDVDQEVVRKLLDTMKERWDRINNEVLQQVEFLESTARKLGEFSERVRAVETPLQRCEERLQDALAAPPARAAETVASLADQIHALRAPLQNINVAADDIVQLALECSGRDAAGRAKAVLEEQAHALADRLDELEARAGEAKGRLAGAAAAMTHFQDKVKNLSHDLSDLEKELDGMKPPGRDIKTVKQQLDDIGRFYKRLENADDLVGDTERAAEQLVDSGYTVDSAKTRDQVEGLRKQLGKLDERARAKEQDLDDTLSKLEAFYKAYDSVMDDVTEASEQVRSLKPVSSEVEQIRSQQKDFAELKRHTLEPLGQNVAHCNKIGQGLVRSALQGVSTQILEKDLEKMNDKWNALKEKTNERERRLDVGLLQSGKFAEALAGLEKWLADTEDMVNNQKPPSADYKVVKAQLQEQKFLKKMLMDRQNSMSSLFAMGNEVAGGCEPAERKAIEKQLKGLMHRFDALTNGAQQRMLDLEQAMKVAKQFQEELQPLVEWLGGTERAVKALQLVPTDEEKIQHKIREHKNLHDDILSKQPAFKQLTETASTLMALVGDDEATALADRLQAATDRYGALVEHSLSIGDLLEASRKGLRHLVLTYQDLSAWMDAMEQYLAKRKILPMHMEKLLRQMHELTEKSKEIASKQEAVDSTVESGLELMKHISGDEALQLKDKLDALQRRYNDLTSRGADLLRVASETLPLVEQLYNSHARLADWMAGAESCLQSVEPREEDILRLEAELQEYRPVLENLNQIGPQLCQISPGEGATHIESIVTRDNRRFDAIAEQVQRKAERLLLSKKRSLEVVGDMEEVLEWLRGVDSALRTAEPPSCEAALVRAQLKEHRPISDDVAAQRVRVRDLLSQAKKVLRECQSSEETAVIRERSEELKEMMEEVGQLAAERLAALEQALPLAEHFADTHHGLSSWLDDMEKQIQMLAMPALRPEQIVHQQDKNEMLQQSISNHKPLVDKLVKTGEALAKLCGDEDAAKVQDIVDADCDRYNALRAELRHRQQDLEQALQESSQFSDKLEGMLRALSGAADQLHRAEPVSAHPPKIEDQIEENNALVEDLEKRQEAYNAVQRAASDVISKANKSDPAVRDIRNKLDKLNKLWDDVQRSSTDRGNSLDSTLEVARKFWQQLNAVMSQLADLEDTLAAQPPPAAQPRAIEAQQVALQEIRHEIDHTKPEVEKVRKTGSTLMSLCGEPDKPEVKKHMEDLDSAWDNITALYARREENLIDAMEKAMEFHDTLQNLLEFLDSAEDKFSRMGALGSDIDAVKRQISQLASFKQEVDPHMVKVEALNRSLMRQAQELTERTSSEQAAAIKAPLTEVNSRWSALLRGMVERQQQLERALLRLGQLQHALQELLTWIHNTGETLDTLRPVAGDPQILEVELAKLKVLVNDIAAHQASVDTLNDAGAQIVQQGTGTDEAGETAEKLATLNRKWRELQQKARDRQTELEDALREAQSFNAEIGDLLSWLSEVDSVIAASKPVGGLPETASEQLERFMEVYNEIEANRPKVEAVLQQGQEYLKKQDRPNPTSQLHHNLKNLKSRWDNVTARASDKKIKLEIALKEATEFHDALQAFVDWLTSAEKTLTSAKPVSRVMETLLVQIEEHKSFQKEVATHRETMLHLDKKGTHLKYFSQKQDVILIKNLLVSVQHRWERVVSKAAERTRALDHGFKEAKEFNEMWNNLMNWLNDTEEQLDALNAEATVNDPEKIKQRLTKHREFQKALAAKQPVYDQTMKTGKQLKDKAPKGDENTLKTMMSDMKTKWTTVCSKAVDRQRKLEEALLYSGQFKDAMSALLDWLKKQQKDLAGDSPVHGDLDTVMALIEQHKQFEEDLHSREQQMQSVMKTGKDLEATVPREDAASIRQQCSELKSAWEAVLTLSERKAHRLEAALKEAEKLHRSVNMLLEWLSDAETKLRFSGQLPEGDVETQQQIRDHERFVRELNEKQRDKDDTISLAHSILSKAHPDAVTVIKHWITIIQSRWDEVWQWAMQRGGKLEAHMQSLKDLDLVLEELLQWLIGLENTLLSLESEPMPESIELLEGLIEDHKELMEHTQKRQNEVDRVCKAYQVKSQSQGRESTPRKVSAKSATKGAPGRGSQHDLHRERSVSPDYYGSRRYRSRIHTRSRRGSRVSPGRETPDRNLPHYGPRFPAKGSKGAEPEFRSPRVKQLWDKWRTVWLLAWERQRRLHERLMHLKELQRVSNFSWDDWRKRFLKFMNHKKSRLTDLFRKMDKDNNGLIARHEFIDGIINTKFDTSRLEMGAVADLFDRNGSGLIDWEQFIAALRPDWVERRGPPTDADKIHDEVKRLVMLCTCRQKFRVFQVGEGKYRFGDSQKLRLVRILRSTVMVRVGGGWVALDEFLVKNDPCRAEEFMEQLRPIFEALRQREELPCSYPLHVGSTHGTKQAFIYGHSRSQGSTTPGAHHYSHHHGYQPSPGYHWVRERTARSVPMSAGGVAGRASRSSLSAGTPDSLSDNEAASGLGARYKKSSVPRSTLTPGGSRPGSRPGSRAGSKPPSRHGSNLSLDSTDDVSTPSRIPMRRVTNTKTSIARAAANANKLGVTTPNGGSRPRTPTGFLTPASGRYPTGGMYRTSSIPTLSPVPALVSSTHSQPSSMASEHPKSLSHTHPAFQTQGSTKIPVYVGNRSHRSPSVERRLKISRKSHSRETSQEPSPTSQGPSRKSEQRSPEDDSSLFSISGMTSDNEYESNISESSGEASKPTQRDVKGSGSFASTEGQTPGRSRIPVLKDHHTNSNTTRQRTPSGSTTPVRSGQQTAVTRLLRKPSDASDSGTPTTPASRRGTPASSRTTEKREPFRH
ncbi:microtubule-actin cross-linking factor 1 isoform X19 [Spodoptera litura]|uniref:Microtubule-actin cross-linking factor 1 isoform X19 n=1 Tax=Spodoptera litura TaxID=69820 RepID=A0A9J7IMV5_SPOLT|nr:microtubule-actin cross-linking factor 1 isoform X19 [Spodoptera litura]